MIPQKEIFIRDIWLSRYIRGNNTDIDTIDKIIQFIRKETVNLKVVTVGVSSGRFIAVLIASKIDAEMCFDFSGQFSLEHHFVHVHRNIWIRDYLEKLSVGVPYTESYCHLDAGKGKTPIYCFLPARC